MKYSMLSKKGKREYNEDYISFLIKDDRACFVLADGLGGHGKGEMASKCVSDSVIHDFEISKDDFSLENAINEAQRKLLTIQKDFNCRDGMKTTIVVVYINKSFLQWAHVGDSRLYLWKHKKIVLRTMDHSVPQMLVMARKIKEKDIRFHEDRNRLLKALGSKNDILKPEISKKIKYKKGQAVLLCSDGFWEYVDEEQMRKKYLFSRTPELWLKKMEEIIWKNGEKKDMDNYSAIAIWF